ncbi:MAG: DEAD/DEAH box helicase, partial [Methanomassiliicoccales archaeon]
MPAEAPKTMPLKLLELPDGVAEILEKEGIKDLYPPQAKAAPIALQGKNLFLAVPTASGKSLVAYLAALRMVLTKGRKVLYMVPLRALASEKTEELKRFEILGLRVGVSVGDLDTPDPDLARYDIIVATSEKADSLLRHGSDWLNAIGLVVADEVHLINDPGRGPTLEVTLSKFRRRDPEIQIIALSATVGNSAEVAEWLQAEHVTSTWRPVKLKEGVYYDERVQFTDNTVKKLHQEEDPIWTLVKDGLADGGQCLIFVNTR